MLLVFVWAHKNISKKFSRACEKNLVPDFERDARGFVGSLEEILDQAPKLERRHELFKEAFATARKEATYDFPL